MDIYERLRSGEPIHTQESWEYKEICLPELRRSRTLCQRINQLPPYDNDVRDLLEELFEGRLPQSSTLTPPMQIDRGHCLTIGERVQINEGFDVMSAGSITIEDDVMIGPQVTVLTSKHDMKNLQVLECEPVVIQRGAWICAKAIICPGVTIGEGAVVYPGAVVTRDVAPHTVVGGNPAQFVKNI